MRIGIDVFPLCSRFPATGIPRAVREILRELQRLDQENDYYLYSKQDFDLPLENPRWHKRLHLGIPYLLGNLYLRIKDGIERRGDHGLDVFWTTRTHSFPVGLPSSVGRVLTVYDVVWLLHPETMEDVNRRALRLFAERGIRQAHKIIAISESTRQGLIETTGVAGKRIEVVHLAVNAGFTPRDRDQSARLIAEKYGASPAYICTVGTVEPRKNIVTLIEAVRILRDRGQLRHQLLIAGQSGWKNSDIYARVESCGLTEHEVRFLGRIPDDDLALLYSGAALFVLPSLYEGFGLPLIEAMACGVPVVASNTSSIPEVVQDAGILVAPQRPEEFADAIVRVTGDAALGRSLAEKGLKRAREFTWEAAALKVRRIFEDAKAAVT
ncbi:MAG TPA: glycosyltransferase family 1 protein [Terriglobia bacterium]|nr:glycosyltransferase family 1 protein [Terriglobia bacterium]